MIYDVSEDAWEIEKVQFYYCSVIEFIMSQCTRDNMTTRRCALVPGPTSKSAKNLLYSSAGPSSPIRPRSKYELRSISFEGGKVLPWTTRFSTDSILRRGVLARRFYGSIEMLPQVDQDGTDGRRFRVENGDSLGEKEEIFGSPSTPVLENPENQTRWYFKYFLGKLHQNYVTCDSERNPLFLSIVLSDGGDQCVPHYRVILWKRTGAQKISLPYPAQKTTTVKQILSTFFGMDKLDKAPREISAPEIQKDLLLLEEQEGSVNFKFGVIYAEEGQTTDDAMLSNVTESPGFVKFLEILGERIQLKGWDKYRGGLDVKGDMTGKESVYTVYAGHEVMYHVSTMLPYSKDNPQQLERKRHIGNDIVNIIYTDDPTVFETFNPNCIKSQFTHVFAIVTSLDSHQSWRVAVYCDETVPLFGPCLPCPPIFNDPYNFREFLLVKLINGEKATFDTPTFSRKRERTLDTLLRDMYQEYVQEGKSNNMLNRRALSDVVDTPGRHREEARAVEMVRVGQALKLEAIVRGLAPTSLATVGPLKPRPWEPRCIYPDFPYDIVCGDVWAENKLVLSTENGTYLLEDGLSQGLIFDKSVLVKQIDVVEHFSILLFRAGEKGRESNVHIYRLNELNDPKGAMDLSSFEDDDEDFENYTVRVIPQGPSQCVPFTRSRTHIKKRRIERTRGCHLYSITKPGGSHLRMCVAVGRRLTILQWKHNAAWTTWCSAADTDTTDGFVLLKEFNATDQPSLITMIDSKEVGNEWFICCGFRHQFELISANGTSRILDLESSSKPHLVAALDLREDEEPELLLCYNNTCHFQKLHEDSVASKEFDFNWNSVPIAVACAFPYVIAFTATTMEIRLIINGNLVHNVALPNLCLISSKRDIFFATTAPELVTSRNDKFSVDGTLSEAEERVAQFSHQSTNLQAPQGDTKPMRIYRIPFHTLSRAPSTHCPRRICSSPTGTDIIGPQPSGDNNLLSVNSHRVLSRSCSSSPTPTIDASFPNTASK
ncbi:GTPase-activating Rap/Ran-GAP domain-like protein 3 [Venturia canescens]|uniref:GTPase-activating Rap/Ran-GAP domain-like protein 3 n=1 Tax=Venturia canescens TaxID=32260 RepID=UPI001C9D268A|nr:GTPase-activating Rap/Ran-GAP domain-like protein 3 [Venturia canescens]